MKILLCSLKGDGIWYAWLLDHNGHEVDWTVTKQEEENSLLGIVKPPKRSPKPANYDLIVFDSTDMGEDADHARSLGIPVIGDSLFADKLEDDRLFGIEAMEKCGIKVPAWEPFDNVSKAIDWLKKTHKRCVLKPFGDAPKDLTYVSQSEEDMIAFLKAHPSQHLKQFILQEFVKGTEVSTEGWWNGTEWNAVNYTLEEKKFLAGGLGPNTGCAGNVLWMPMQPTPLFQQGLDKVSPLLVDANYRGMLDLNTIVTEAGVYGLEWTPRFGYHGTCNLARLLPVEFGEFLYNVATGVSQTNLIPKARFAATLTLSVPPFPSKLYKEAGAAHQPIKGLQVEDLDVFFAFDVNKEGDGLFVVDEGDIGTPIALGESIHGAFEELMKAVHRLEVPDLQYRVDVEKCVTKRYETLQYQGWLRQIG